MLKRQESVIQNANIRSELVKQKIDYRVTYIRLRGDKPNKKFSYGYPQLYAYYLAYKNLTDFVSYEDFKVILKEYADMACDEVASGLDMKPFKTIGYIVAVKRRLKAIEALFLLREAHRPLNPTDHSDGFYVQVKWYRPKGIQNNRAYRFISSDNMSNRIYKNIMNGNHNCYLTSKK